MARFALQILVLAVFAGSALAAAPAAPLVVPPGDEDGLAAPVTIDRRSEDIWRTLARAAWIGERDAAAKTNGKVLYAVTFRSCPTCAAFKAAEHDALLKAGVEIRWIVYARRDRDGKPRSKPGERAMVAELWLSRNAGLMNQWWAAEDLDAFYQSGAVPPPADGVAHREGALARSRAFVDTLSGLLADNQVEMAIPALIWREGPKTQVYIGYSSAGFAPARAFLTSP